ncbi:lipid A deacylase LpxR family protein [Marinobacter sp. DUT-3]|uniref:lipid A deacylase LpxR family protein n=1 Tax=Marinobacter sp. DUT-3 TaxID=3412036 RepID=UPI003D1690C9
MRIRNRIFWPGRQLAKALLILWSWEASADSPNGTWFLSVDNDSFAQTDDHYTNGLQIGWVSGYLEKYEEGPVPGFVATGLGSLPLINKQGRQRFISHSLSHRIFTPNDTETTEAVENDVPYSGMLFASLTAGAQDAKNMDAFTFYYGFAGPSARGEEVQNEFHRLIGVDQVNGWDHQIHDEILLNVAYEHRRRLWSFGSNQGWGGDVIGQLGGSLGNLISMATAGIGARFGWGVPDDYGIPPQFFGEETIGSRPYTSYGTQSGVWLFTLLNGSYIANAIFWDGNTFKDSMSVDYDPGIARLYTGINARSGNWSGSFAITKTTVPWENPTDRKVQTYGRIGITYTY